METFRAVASPRQVTPQELVINLTYRCPLRCSHCCFSSDMSFSAHLSLDEVLGAIDDAARIESIGRIDFVGGDPFLHTDIMEAAFRHACRYGISPAVVTSAYWATTEERALAILAPLVSAGLARITISYDDQHAEFLKEKNIVHAHHAARALGIAVKIAIVVSPGARIDGAYMARLLGLSEEGDERTHIYETYINSTGRALESASEEDLEERRQSDKAYLGPCLSALRQFSINADGKVQPCCGVIPYRDGLGIGELGKMSVDQMIREAYQNPVMLWLAFEGPVAILRQITANTDNPLTDADFDGICNACDVLFTNPRYIDLLREAIPAKAESLSIQAALLKALDIYRPPAQAPITIAVDAVPLNGSAIGLEVLR